MSAEEFARAIVERVLGVPSEIWDVWPRQGAYDVRINYADGRTGAMEVTTHAAGGQRQIEGELGRDDFKWPLPGRWWWTISFPEPHQIPWLRANYRRLILLCEQHEVWRPEHLPLGALGAEDRDRLEQVDITGHPDVLAVDGTRSRSCDVLRGGFGGGVDSQLLGLHDALADLFDVPSIAKRVSKVVAAGESEAHLFLGLDISALPFPVSYALAFESALPSRDPPLPDGVTHLWLVPRNSRRLLLWSANDGWKQYEPYD